MCAVQTYSLERCFLFKNKSVYYKNYTLMALNFMQTIKGERISNGRVLHQVNKGSWIKCYKNAIKDGAEKIENVLQ